MVSEKRSFRCRIGLHRWRRVTWKNPSPWVWPEGRRCDRCGRVEERSAGMRWRSAHLSPNKDVNGYY